MERDELEALMTDSDLIVTVARALVRPAWHADAACREHPELTWFPSRGQTKMGAAARAVCETCLVRVQCLDDALTVGTDAAGIWGGLTEKERTEVRRSAA